MRLRGPPGLPFRSPRRLHPRRDPPRASPRGRSLGPEDRWARRFGPGARALPHSLSLGVLRASRGASPGFIPPSGGLKRPRRRAAGTELRAASAAAGGAQPPALRTRSAWLLPRRPGRPLGAATTFRSAGRTVDPPGARERPGRGREPTRPAGIPGASRGCCWARVQAGGSPCSPPLLSGLGALRLAPPPPRRCALGRCAPLDASHGSFGPRGCGTSRSQQPPAHPPARPTPTRPPRRRAALLRGAGAAGAHARWGRPALAAPGAASPSLSGRNGRGPWAAG